MAKNKYNDIKSILDEVEKDFAKFYEGGNKAAGTRVRKAMTDLKNKAQDIRKDVQNLKNKEKAKAAAPAPKKAAPAKKKK